MPGNETITERLREALARIVIDAVAEEREACAEVCDDYARRAWSAQHPSPEAAVAAQNLANAIRTRIERQ